MQAEDFKLYSIELLPTISLRISFQYFIFLTIITKFKNYSQRTLSTSHFFWGELVLSFWKILLNLLFSLVACPKWMLARTRSSRSQMFYKIGFLKSFGNFTGKHLCWRLQGDSNTGFFLWNLRNFQEHPFLQNNSAGCF